MLRLLPALLLVSCAAEVPPRADVGGPRALPLGAVAALDGSFSEGDDLSFAWSVEPAEGAVLQDADSPFASLTVEAPGVYTLRLEVCDPAGRCDMAETWAWVDDPASVRKITDFGIDEFASATSGAGAPLSVADSKKCADCKAAAEGDQEAWDAFCSKVAPGHTDAARQERAACRANNHQSENNKKGWCYERYCN